MGSAGREADKHNQRPKAVSLGLKYLLGLGGGSKQLRRESLRCYKVAPRKELHCTLSGFGLSYRAQASSMLNWVFCKLSLLFRSTPYVTL